MSHMPNVLLVRPDLPFKTVQELIAYAKANPDKLNYASQGIGTTSHLTTELFETITHTKLVHVPYKGTAPALNDLIASHVDLMFSELATSVQLHKAGKARILAVAANSASPPIPDIPTLDEAGVSGLRIRHLERAHRAAEDAGRHHRQAQRRRQQGDEGPRAAASTIKQLNLTPGGGTPARDAAPSSRRRRSAGAK